MKREEEEENKLVPIQLEQASHIDIHMHSSWPGKTEAEAAAAAGSSFLARPDICTRMYVRGYNHNGAAELASAITKM